MLIVDQEKLVQVLSSLGSLIKSSKDEFQGKIRLRGEDNKLHISTNNGDIATHISVDADVSDKEKDSVDVIISGQKLLLLASHCPTDIVVKTTASGISVSSGPYRAELRGQSLDVSILGTAPNVISIPEQEPDLILDAELLKQAIRFAGSTIRQAFGGQLSHSTILLRTSDNSLDIAQTDSVHLGVAPIPLLDMQDEVDVLVESDMMVSALNMHSGTLRLFVSSSTVFMQSEAGISKVRQRAGVFQTYAPLKTVNAVTTCLVDKKDLVDNLRLVTGMTGKDAEIEIDLRKSQVDVRSRPGLDSQEHDVAPVNTSFVHKSIAGVFSSVTVHAFDLLEAVQACKTDRIAIEVVDNPVCLRLQTPEKWFQIFTVLDMKELQHVA